MKLKLVGCLIIFLSGQACNTKNSNTTPGSEHQTEILNKDSIAACYRFANTQDTISLNVNTEGDSITGTLVYKLHEKDKNVGTISGNMKGDILVADYTFMSEGVESVRQVAFKKVNNVLLEGYGEINSTNNRAYFKNLDSLQFNTKFELKEISCR